MNHWTDKKNQVCDSYKKYWILNLYRFEGHNKQTHELYHSFTPYWGAKKEATNLRVTML